jgi:hypothetical protein
MAEVYINLNKDFLAKTGLKATEAAEKSLGEDEKNTFLYDSCTMNQETEISDGEIAIYGTVYDGSQELGYIDVRFRPDMDDIITLIDFYMKKLGKLKTVMEATK